MEELWSSGLTESASIVSDIELQCQSEETIPQFVIAVRLADSLSKQQRYCEAIEHYERVIRCMKAEIEGGQSFGKEGDEGVGESDVRMRLATCQYKMKQYGFVLETLRPIVHKMKGQCSVQAAALCATTHMKLGQRNDAVDCYKDVLRRCPLALEAINGLLRAGVKSAEILLLIPSEILSRYCWLSVWIDAREKMEKFYFKDAVTVLQSLTDKSVESSELLAELAYSQWMAGQLDDARKSFRRARCLNTFVISHMDSYAHLLFIDNNQTELENLATSLQQSSQQHCESWIAISYLSYLTDKKTRALYFSQKACSLDDTNVEAIILSGFLLYKFNKPQEGVLQYRQAVMLSPGHFYANEGLVLCLVECPQKWSAELTVQTLLKTVGYSARAYVLWGIAISNDDEANRKRKREMFMKAISMDATLSRAHLLLAESFRDSQQCDRAIKTLEAGLSQVEVGQVTSLLIALAEILQLVGRPEDAMEQYKSALRLNPNCDQALHGLREVEARITDYEPLTDFTGEYEFDPQATDTEI
ncbi:anaphase-promoting complex subunit 7-like isoform X2 [Corticium candelabrum]|uniref:anaphase-promoting complex subunit 7-like isoform X2 n=1 Tax=Corticium candelabrum TaxID=121492 RepID=UPI002E2716E1|nr:anaphase-promoting complex subunit 7-like isoform X2 [Corticium candelabrum]